MIKSLNRNDRLVTPFEAKKSWETNNLYPSDLILWMSQSFDTITGKTSSFSGSICHTYIDYGDNSESYPITNSYCHLALQQQESSYVTYQKGVYNPNITYPLSSFYTASSKYYNTDVNPRNVDGTYMNLVYEQNKHLFYNNYNNFTKTFGMESAELSDTNRLLTNEMDVFTIPQKKFGEKIVPNSVKIVDISFDKSYTIVDDGNCNLIFSGSVFSTYEIDNLLSSSKQGFSSVLTSLDYNNSSSNVYSNISLQRKGETEYYDVTSSLMTLVNNGGVAPYNVTWYIGGDYKSLWKLQYQGKLYNTLQYNSPVLSSSQVLYKNTYVICKATDYNNTQIFSNLIYLNSGSAGYLYTSSGDYASTVAFPPADPAYYTQFRLTDTGEAARGTLIYVYDNGEIVDILFKLTDDSYILYNYTPHPNVVSSVAGVPSDINPSSSYIGYRKSNWLRLPNSRENLPTDPTIPHIVDWISPINESERNYGNSYAGDYTYRIYFDLTSISYSTGLELPIDPNGFSLSGSWAVDASGSMYINGIYTGNSITMSGVDDITPYTTFHTFNITGGFVPGRNYIDFKIHNVWPSGSRLYTVKENPIGLCVEYDRSNILFPTY